MESVADAHYDRVAPLIEATKTFAKATYQSIYIIDYFKKNFLYVSDNPLFLCGHTVEEVFLSFFLTL